MNRSQQLLEKMNSLMNESEYPYNDDADEVNNSLALAEATMESLARKHSKAFSPEGLKKLKKYRSQLLDIMNDVNDLWQDEGITPDWR